MHPIDEGIRDGHTSLYFGAAGVVWGIDYLGRAGATKTRFDFRSVLPRLLAASQDEFAKWKYAAHGSLLLGDIGADLVVMRVDPASAIADLIYTRADANTTLPVRELMWGIPGSMIACCHMASMTAGPRWRDLFEIQATRLLGDLEQTDDGPLWTQDLYGSELRYHGPVHGYAGNMIALMRGRRRARSRQNPCEPGQLEQCLRAALPAMSRSPPGMVTAFADAPFMSIAMEDLLRDGGKFTWGAGPLAKGSNLCHGTGGNGYAFLKLYRRTNDVIWLNTPDPSR